VSPSPLKLELPSADQRDTYAEGWQALNKLLRQGYSWSGNERHAVFLNLGDGRFADASRASGLDLADDGRALALVDWDFDGDQDLFLTNRNGPRVRFFENRVEEKPPRFALRLEDEVGRVVIGARVEVRSEGPTGPGVMRTLRAGGGYLAQSSRWLHFPRPGVAFVTWPGEVEPEVFDGFDQDEGFFSLRRGTGTARSFEPKSSSSRDLAPFPPYVSTEAARVVLAAPVPLPSLSLTSSRGGALSLFGIEPGGKAKGTGRAIVLHLFASWCAPCVRELGTLAKEAEALAASGIAFLALSVESEPEERAAAKALMERLAWPFSWGFASAESTELLDALAGVFIDGERRLPLPTSFLIDAQGNLRAIYFGPVSAAVLARDRSLLKASPEEQLAAAAPFEGTWLYPIESTSTGWMEGRLRVRGMEAAAREYGRGAIRLSQSSPADVIHGFGRRAASEGDLRGAQGYFLQALEKDPEHFDSQFDLAVLFHRDGKLADAATAYAKALSLKSEDVDTHFNLGLVYVGMGNLEAARSEVRWLTESNAELASTLAGEIRKRE